MRLRAQQIEYQILERSERILDLTDLDSALRFLSRFAADPVQLSAMRGLLEEYGTSVSVMSDHEVIAAVAMLMVDGRIEVLRRTRTSSARSSRLPDEGAVVGTVPPRTAPKKEPEVEKTWVEIELVDCIDGTPIPEEEYRIELPDGSVATGKLDRNGRARVNTTDPGTCIVTFPKLDRREMCTPLTGGPVLQPAETLTWIELVLVDEDDVPVPDAPYSITFADGSVRKGTLDRKGRARVEKVSKGTCTVTFPGIDRRELV